MSIRRRLACLESRSGECFGCGHSSSVSERIEVVWDDLDGTDTEDEGPEFCGTCGRQTVYIVEWLDLEGAEPGVGS